MNLIEYADRDMLAIDLANILAGNLKQALLHHDTASLAVPGARPNSWSRIAAEAMPRVSVRWGDGTEPP